MKFLYGLVCVIIAPFLLIFHFLRCTGRENIPKKGGYILAANHLSAMDMFFIAVFMPKQVRYLAKAELFKNPLMRILYHSAGAIPLERASSGTAPFKEACAVLGNDEVLGIFPQGTRCRGKAPENTAVKHGVAYIACISGADILPVHIETKNYKTALFRRVTVHFGKVIKNSELGFSDATADNYTEATNYIFKRICELKESTGQK